MDYRVFVSGEGGRFVNEWDQGGNALGGLGLSTSSWKRGRQDIEASCPAHGHLPTVIVLTTSIPV